MNALIKILLIVAIIGALNWGLVGFFEWNLVQALFTGEGSVDASIGSRIVYALVGLAGLFGLFALPRMTAVRHATPTRAAA